MKSEKRIKFYQVMLKLYGSRLKRDWTSFVKKQKMLEMLDKI